MRCFGQRLTGAEMIKSAQKRVSRYRWSVVDFLRALRSDASVSGIEAAKSRLDGSVSEYRATRDVQLCHQNVSPLRRRRIWVEHWRRRSDWAPLQNKVAIIET